MHHHHTLPGGVTTIPRSHRDAIVSLPDAPMVHSSLKLEWLSTEIWWHILSFITTKNYLLHLCSAFKYFLPECRRLLYRDVQLKGTRSLILWTETILSSPAHAALVMSLALPTRGKLSTHHQNAVSQSLAKLPNLAHLTISHRMTDNCTGSYLTPHMLKGIPKCLKTFQSDLEDTDFQQALFAPSGLFGTHSSLERLYIAGTGVEGTLRKFYGGEIPNTVLPKLTTLRVEHLGTLNAFRTKPIRRLRIGRVDLAQKNVEQLMAVLGSFQTGTPLVSLCIGLYETPWNFIPGEQCDMNSFITQLASCAPNLAHLCILGDITEHIDSKTSVASFISSLEALSNLRTLILGTSRPVYLNWDSSTYTDAALCTPRRTITLTEQFFNHCKNLEKVSFACSSGKYRLQRGSAVGWKAICFAKSRSAFGGVVELEGEDVLDDESWALI